MKKVLSVFIITAMAISCLTACGEKKEPETTTAVVTEAETTTEEATTEEVTTEETTTEEATTEETTTEEATTEEAATEEATTEEAATEEVVTETESEVIAETAAAEAEETTTEAEETTTEAEETTTEAEETTTEAEETTTEAEETTTEAEETTTEAEETTTEAVVAAETAAVEAETTTEEVTTEAETTTEEVATEAESETVEETTTVDDITKPAEETTEAEEATEEATEATEGVITMGDYSVIEIAASAIDVPEEEIQAVLENVAAQYVTTENIEEGVCELGDTVNIDFSGILEGEEEPFDGGTATGYDLALGSGSMIPGFEDAIVGHEVGETFDIEVTFPEDYYEDLANKAATFTITVNHKVNTVYPELSDEMVKTYSEANLEKTVETIDEFTAYVEEILANNKLESAIFAQIKEITTIESYDSNLYGQLVEYYQSELDYTASNYGIDADTICLLYGFDSALQYAEAKTEDFLTTYMIIEKVCEDEGIVVTQEEVDEELVSYMDSIGYGSMFASVDEIKATVGDIFMVQLETSIKAEVFMEALKSHVVIIEDETTAVEAESAAEETVTEDTTVAETVEETTVEDTTAEEVTEEATTK